MRAAPLWRRYSRAWSSIMRHGTVVPPRQFPRDGAIGERHRCRVPEDAPRHASAMTANGKGMPKYARVAESVRAQIADGTLRPGQPAPSGAALSRVTGYSTLTCRKALRVLIADGALVPGPSRNARPRVAGPPQPPAERDLAAAARALAAGLAGSRRANGLTQPELAGRVGVSVSTVGHAETGRLWQSRQFWERADAILGAGGALLKLHDAYRAASAPGAADSSQGACGAAIFPRAA